MLNLGPASSCPFHRDALVRAPQPDVGDARLLHALDAPVHRLAAGGRVGPADHLRLGAAASGFFSGFSLAIGCAYCCAVTVREKPIDLESRPGMTPGGLFTRRAGWAIAFAIVLAVMLAGGGVVFWTIYSKSRLPSITNLGVALVVFGFAVAVVLLGLWIASSGQRGPQDGP